MEVDVFNFWSILDSFNLEETVLMEIVDSGIDCVYMILETFQDVVYQAFDYPEYYLTSLMWKN